MKKNTDKQKMTENLQLIKMVFNQLVLESDQYSKKFDDYSANLAS